MRKTQIRECVRKYIYDDIDHLYCRLADRIKLSMDDGSADYAIRYVTQLLRSACKRIDIDYSGTNISESEDC